MTGITRQRDIIDRRMLAEQLSAVAQSIQCPALDRAPFVAPLREALTAGRVQEALEGDLVEPVIRAATFER